MLVPPSASSASTQLRLFRSQFKLHPCCGLFPQKNSPDLEKKIGQYWLNRVGICGDFDSAFPIS